MVARERHHRLNRLLTREEWENEKREAWRRAAADKSMSDIPSPILEAMARAAIAACSASYLDEKDPIECVTVDGNVDFPAMVQAALSAANDLGYRLESFRQSDGRV